MAKTRPGQTGVGLEAYGGFSPKTPASNSPHNGNFTRLLSIGIGGRRRLTASKGIGPFTRLTSIGINGRRVSFVAKSPAGGGGKGVGQFTRLLNYGIGGRRVLFVAKSQPIPDENSKGHGKKLTKRQIQGLREIYGYEKDSTEVLEKAILPEGLEIQVGSVVDFISETIDIPDSQDIYVDLQEQLQGEEEIGLILAILESHFN